MNRYPAASRALVERGPRGQSNRQSAADCTARPPVDFPFGFGEEWRDGDTMPARRTFAGNRGPRTGQFASGGCVRGPAPADGSSRDRP